MTLGIIFFLNRIKISYLHFKLAKTLFRYQIQKEYFINKRMGAIDTPLAATIANPCKEDKCLEKSINSSNINFK